MEKSLPFTAERFAQNADNLKRTWRMSLFDAYLLEFDLELSGNWRDLSWEGENNIQSFRLSDTVIIYNFTSIWIYFLLKKQGCKVKCN